MRYVSWNDERIFNTVTDNGTRRIGLTQAECDAHMRTMRDEYEARLADMSKQLEAMAERYRQIDEFYLSQAKRV